MKSAKAVVLAFCLVGIFFVANVFAQETTGGLQGTVKDPNGAVITSATVQLSGSSLVGIKEQKTDTSGYYRFANLPPGQYTISVSAPGFSTLKRQGVDIGVGRLPTVDLTMKVGAAETVVEVSSAAPVIDVTTTRTMTNLPENVLQDVPHGRTFQSVIQFAPAARNEPLAGAAGGTGGGSPGSTGNGSANGYSIAGGADSENSYLVEGQETANVIGGYSHTTMPFEFIQEVQIKSSGVEAEHGGSLGGVINVIQKRGGNAWHGSFGATYESSALDGSPNAFLRYNPQDPGTYNESGSLIADPAAQTYQPKKDEFKFIQPSFTIGGPIKKDRLWMFLGFAPLYNSRTRRVDFGGNTGLQTFNQDTQTYYATGRLDATVTQKARVYASWLYQYQRESGAVMPTADSTQGLYNPSTSAPLYGYEHGYGFAAPDHTMNLGADITLTPRLVSTTRFGYYFENYHDFGYPSSGTLSIWGATGTGGVDTNGDPLPTALQQPAGYFNSGYNQNFTVRNASKHHQFDEDIAWYKSGWLGTHNFKFGYQLNHLYNDIFQRWNIPEINVYPGQPYFAGGSTGFANCASYAGPGISGDGYCEGQYGYIVAQDYGSLGKASSYNHGFFAQDAWTIGKGITIDAGLRIEKEYLPGETRADGFPAEPIQFGWGDKIAPRLGAAWDVFRDGRMKVFGSYGVYNDIMKLNLAISSFGGQYWQNCAYLLDTPDLSTINLAFDNNYRFCTGDSTGGANFAGGTVPAGLTFIENQNFRGTEGVTPGLKPYRQHEGVLGVDYQIAKNVAFEARWDRRRLDHAIEDAALFDSTGSEVFTIVNPGEGQNATNTACGSLCPANIKAARSYDGLELRVTKTSSRHWQGMFSYTYSKLRGNYAGLTNTDLSDGAGLSGGRNAPNNSRAFDESYFQFNAYGGSSSGPLATDRPNTFKGYAYYTLPWGGGRQSTSIGIFQVAYSGTPLSSYIDVGYALPGGFPVYPEGRGKWVDLSGGTGNLSVTGVHDRRTPWYTQSDLNLQHEFKISKNNEAEKLAFDATVTNLFNQRAVTAYFSQIDSAYTYSFLTPGGVPFYYGQPAYSAYEHAYDWKSLLNTNGIVPASLYGQPILYQQSRNFRLGVTFTF